MSADRGPANAFLEALPAAIRARWPDAAELSRILADLLQEISARPSPAVSQGELLKHLAQKLGVFGADRMKEADLRSVYLAFAAAHGDADAMAAVEARAVEQARRVVERWGGAQVELDEVLQRVRHALFLGVEDKPKLLEYGGQGSFNSWLRAVALRVVLNLTRRPLLRAEEAEVEQLVAMVDDPELILVKGVYLREFRRAFSESLRSLPRDEATLLHQYYFDGLRLEELAALQRMHVSTLSRKLARIRQQVLEGTRTRLSEQLALAPSEIDSILRLIQSRLEVSAGGLVRESV